MEKLRQHFEKWCVWQLGAPRGKGKPAKIPRNPNTGAKASAADPGTFGTYEEAQAALTDSRYAGVGVLMASGDGIICVDIDSCLGSDGTPDKIAEWAVCNFSNYCEVSQSATGLHFFLLGKKPPGCKSKVTLADGHSLEIYGPDDKRYIAVTGNERIRQAKIVEEQAALDRFIAKFGFLARETVGVPRKTASVVAPDTDTDEAPHSDEEILKLLRRNNKRGRITRLLKGDLADYAGDHSGADLALASEIAYYTTDPEQVARIFAESGLSKRDKWQQREDYRDRTISKALDSCNGYYWDRDSAGGKAGFWMAAARHEYLVSVEGLQTVKGKLQSNIYNATEVLLRDQRTRGAVGFNMFSGAIEVLRPLRSVFGEPASATLGELSDADVIVLRAWLIREYGLSLRKADVDDAATMWARHNEFNPATDALDRCAKAWDGTPRLSAWLAEYLGADATNGAEYLSEIGRRWLISAVARAFAPGCKVDCVLVLEGAQGVGKSRVARMLAEAIYPEGFIENIPVIGESQETARALRGAFIVELPELTSIRRSDSEHVKAFISTRSDRARAPYGRRYENWLRTCVFVGTTNEAEYIQDTSGGRRFWAVRVGRIDIERLQSDLAQLWGEAVCAYRDGETWHLSGADAVRQATEQQQERMVTDSWDDDVHGATLKLIHRHGVETDLWSLADLYHEVFQQHIAERPQGDQKRFAGALRRAGFVCRKTSGRNRWSLARERIHELRNAH